MVVKRRPRLQTNILLACLAATDAVLTGQASGPTIVLSVGNAQVTWEHDWEDESGNHRRSPFPQFVSTHRRRVFLASSDAGYGREAYGYQVHHALPLCCYKAEHKAHSDHALDLSYRLGDN